MNNIVPAPARRGWLRKLIWLAVILVVLLVAAFLSSPAARSSRRCPARVGELDERRSRGAMLLQSFSRWSCAM